MRSTIAALAALTLVLGFAGCHSVLPYKLGGMPKDIKPGASPLQVRLRMGEPEWIEYVDNPESRIQKIWHYEDHWWTEDRWANKWASWDVYFDGNDEFIGWKMVEPTIQEDRARRAVYVRQPRG